MKKLNKFFAILVALAMMAMLCVSTAFAAPEVISDDDMDTKAPAAADANIVKYLQIPEGVNAATAPKEYTFTFTPYAVSASSLTVEDMPAIANKSITVSIPTQVTDDGQSLYGYLPLSFLNDISWPGNGVYTYIVEEVEGTNAAIDYDDGAYAINIYKEAGGITHVTGQEAEKEVTPAVVDPDTGETITPESTTYTINDGKEDVTVTDPTVPEDPDDPDLNDEEDSDDDDVIASDKEDDGKIMTEGLTFTNIYTVSSAGDNKYGALSIEKTVDADTPDNAAEFPFELTITAPTGHEGEEFLATVWNADGATTTTYKFKDGVAKEFKLKNGEYLKFETSDLFAGSKYTVTEKLATSDVTKKDMYSPSYTLYTADTDTVATGTKTDAAQAGQNLGIEVNPLIKETSTKELAAYVNTFDDDLNTPTGILMNNLPFIVLALVAIGGLVAYVVVRRRDADEA